MSPRTYNRPLMSRAWYMVLCLAMQPHSAGAFVHLSASWSPVSAQPSRLLHSSAQLRTTPLRRRCETSSLRLGKTSCLRIRGGAQTGAYHTLRNRCIPNVEIQSLHLYSFLETLSYRIHKYIYIYIHMYIYIYAFMHVYMYICIHIYIYTFIYVYTYMCSYIYV